MLLCLVVTTPLLSQTQLDHGDFLGGDLSYRFIEEIAPGKYQYRITLNLYRVCIEDEVQKFAPEYIGVFHIDSTGKLQLDQELKAIPNIVQTNKINQCESLLHIGNCIENAEISYDLILNSGEDDYLITYQRCCKLEWIPANTDQGVPNRSSGMTLSLKISQKALKLHNSSPKFNRDFEHRVCIENSWDHQIFDFSAIDPDGDSLHYELCHPLLGGGRESSEADSTAAWKCNGLQPRPTYCLPGFDSVTYLPGYSYTHPTDSLELSEKSGIFKMEISKHGVWLISMCVSEYRNGVLLGKVLRDFSFPHCFVKPQAIIGPIQYICEDSFFVLPNLSYHHDTDSSIYDWTISNGQVTWNSKDTFPKVPVYMFKSNDSLDIKLVLFKGEYCADSTEIRIKKFPGIEADFDYTVNSCKGGPIQLNSDSKSSDSRGIKSYYWTNGVTYIGDKERIVINPTEWKKQEIKLVVEDHNGCWTEQKKYIPYYPVPENIPTLDTIIQCDSAQFTTDLITLLDLPTSYKVHWDFGDGNESRQKTPFHTFTKAGNFDVILKITSPGDCILEQKVGFVQVVQNPPIEIVIEADDPIKSNSLVSFNLVNSNFDQVSWYIDDSYISFGDTITHKFKVPGNYQVTAIGESEPMCQISESIQVMVVAGDILFLPNAFSPNDDQVNDIYRGYGDPDLMESYRMTIWDRWGTLLFESTDLSDGWNGYYKNQLLPAGVYVCRMVIKDKSSQIHTLTKSITLVY